MKLNPNSDVAKLLKRIEEQREKEPETPVVIVTNPGEAAKGIKR